MILIGIKPIEINGDMILHLASVVAARMNSDEPFIYSLIDLDEDFIKKCAKASKNTLLHDYISFICEDNFDYLIRKAPEAAIEEIKAWLDSLGLDYSHVKPDKPIYDDVEEDEETLYADGLIRFFEENALEVVVESTFCILFQDKDFLYGFNQRITDLIRNLHKEEWPDYLEGDGYFKRETPPNWLKRGIFFRDRGRCQSCGTDLTKIFEMSDLENYDHIIPLRQGGTNDPTNYQLMCEHCNKSKQDRSSKYRNIVWPYWSD